ncbi:MAG: mechanosensitive ion channel [Candidatus Cloacimonetes bacterium]|nr:mechanosensitive ion channel [Candidatus Cloacimonadota bacterium]
MEQILPKLYEWISALGLKLIAAIAILFIGQFIVKLTKKFLVKVLKKKEVDTSIVSFISSLTYNILLVFVILAAMAQLGIQTTSFIAVIGAAGLAIGLSLQGSLSNFAAGFLILILRPFKSGDAVEAGGVLGIINRINMFNSEFKTFDNKRVFVPNSQIMNGTITNYTAEDKRRVDLVVSTSYSTDIQKVKDIVLEIISKHELILDEPAPFIRLSEMADSSLNFKVRVWSNTVDYWTVYFDIMEQVKVEFDKNGVSIPFPQMDVHLKKK